MVRNVGSVVLRKSRAAACLFCTAGLLWVLPAEAGVSTAQIWRRISAADSRVTAARTVWKYDYRVPPNPAVDVEQSVARAQEQARQQGLSARDTAGAVQVARYVAGRIRDGWGYSSKKILEYNTPLIREDELDPRPLPKPTHRARLFMPDGNYIELGAPQNGLPLGYGNVGRVGPGGLQFDTSLCRYIFLLNIPVERVFPPDKTSVTLAANGSIVLQRVLQRLGERTSPQRATLFVSPVTVQPFEFTLETFGIRWIPGTRIAVSGYRQYAGGIRLPSRVALTTHGGMTETYTLQAGSFNAAADVSNLSHSLPPGIALSDYRLGMKKRVNYRFTGKLPSEAQLEALAPRTDPQRNWRGWWAVLFLICGPVLAVLLIWRTRRRRR